jgi:hypothetical protein
MQILPTYITFSQAKLLKELKFEVKSKYHYPNLSDKQDICIPTDWNTFTDMSGNSKYYTAPQQWEILEWLRLKYGIVILSVIKHTKGIGLHYGVDIWQHIKDVEAKYMPTYIHEDYLTPQEAINAALDYILPTLNAIN